MDDDLSLRVPEDKNRISMKEPWEVEYWTKTLGVTLGELECAVDAVGTATAAVKKHLRKS